jgi:hypothetical protein
LPLYQPAEGVTDLSMAWNGRLTAVRRVEEDIVLAAMAK